jgi:hypothetical protein
MQKKQVNGIPGRSKWVRASRAVDILKIVLLSGYAMLGAQAVLANTTVPDECYHAARVASHEFGVPYNVLLAITRVETGRKIDGSIEPWPWAINHAGSGDWLSNKSDLLETALALIARGEHSFDVGCFQINYRWHGAEFTSLDQMISPKENALYAAKFLRTLYDEFGDWTEAAGAYHSRTENLSNKYKAKFLVHYDEDFEPLRIAMRSEPVREAKKKNSYPLLVNRSSQARLGSLMPETSK